VTADALRLAVPGGDLDLDVTFVDAPPEEIERQAAEYARGERTDFDLPIRFPETFTGAVMREMCAIPYGETRTYGELAAALDTAPIAVGQACARNPLPLVVPCHRVVASDGGLRGYSGAGGLDQKRALLDHEGVR
jgi:methylated-DNA-[protein]-cysteine S-methyltransferase